MKKIKCYDCETTFSADTSEQVLNQMHQHYMEMHKDIISSANEEQKKVWMEQFHKDWEDAETI